MTATQTRRAASGQVDPTAGFTCRLSRRCRSRKIALVGIPRSSPHPWLSVACLLISVLGAAPAREAVPEEAPWKASCRRARDVALPAGDQPDAGKRGQLEKCKSEELFYGIGRKADPDQARLCAYIERADGDRVVFGGSAMLMTIYATGLGAPRNIPLAIHLACDLDGANLARLLVQQSGQDQMPAIGSDAGDVRRELDQRRRKDVRRDQV